MKRGGPIQRKAPLKNRSELKASKPMERKPMERRRKPRRQAANDDRWRSEAYLAWVRSLSCCVCGAPANAAHHLKGIWYMSGAGLKAPDSMVMPVCDGPGDTCHRRIHNEQALRDRQPAFLRDTLSRAVRAFEGDTKAELIKAWRIIEEREAA